MRQIYLGEFNEKEKEAFLREITKNKGIVAETQVIWPEDAEPDELDELIKNTSNS